MGWLGGGGEDYPSNIQLQLLGTKQPKGGFSYVTALSKVLEHDNQAIFSLNESRVSTYTSAESNCSAAGLQRREMELRLFRF